MNTPASRSSAARLPLAAAVLAAAAALLARAAPARADDVLHPGTPTLDPPTVTALGVQLPITGDDNFNATVAVRYRVAGTTAWRDGLPLLHVHAELVTGLTVPPQFAGSIFDLAPDTAYEIELHATDADGGVDMRSMLMGRTRPVPRAMPAHPRMVMATDTASLNAALAGARAGDVITLANGMYAGQFSLNASGTDEDPIVVRGASQDGAVLDGMGCTGCNVLEVYGSHVHLESLTLQHADRALRFQGMGAQDNVVRRVHIRDVVLGIGSRANQQNFYICDNVLEGRLVWPCVYSSMDPACNRNASGTIEMGLHANDDGIHVEGDGHVVCHNRISGFGDAMKTEQDGARSVDFYGNDVLWTYDNGIELDGSARNTRALRNRFTNTYATLSFQPIFGGPSYAARNVLVNVTDEQFKLHSRGSTPTVGAQIFHNTIVRATRALQCATSAPAPYFVLENNLFVGPTALDPDMHAVRFDLPDVRRDTIDYNGYYPDGQYEYGYANGSGGVTYPNFAALVAGGMWEAHGVLCTANTLAGGLVGPADWHTTLMPQTPTLAAGSPAIDRATMLPNLDDGFQGAAPDLGAIESGCGAPVYGVRPMGTDESNESTGCAPGNPGGDAGAGDAGSTPNDAGGTNPDGGARSDAGGGTNPDGGAGGSRGGCGCRTAPARAPRGVVALGALLGALALSRRRRGARR